VVNRPVYVLHLRPESGVDAALALRAALKTLLRTFGLRCVSIRRELPMLEEPGEHRIADTARAHGSQ
jgi:hypothetical protein